MIAGLFCGINMSGIQETLFRERASFCEKIAKMGTHKIAKQEPDSQTTYLNVWETESNLMHCRSFVSFRTWRKG